MSEINTPEGGTEPSTIMHSVYSADQLPDLQEAARRSGFELKVTATEGQEFIIPRTITEGPNAGTHTKTTLSPGTIGVKLSGDNNRGSFFDALREVHSQPSKPVQETPSQL